MERDQAFAIAFTWLKGPRGKPYITVARALERLRAEPEFRSINTLAQQVGVSGQIVREFLSLLSLPSSVQDMLEAQELTLDKGKNLVRLDHKRPDLTVEVAKRLCSVPYQHARDVVDYLIRNPESSIETAFQRVAESKPKTVDEFNIIATLNREEFVLLEASARRRKISPNRLVTEIVKEWIDSAAERQVDESD